MALYAIGDTHLSLGTNKPMDVFGGGWTGYVDKLRQGFACVGPEDTVVLCGDLVCVYKVIGQSVFVYRVVNGRTDYPQLLK